MLARYLEDSDEFDSVSNVSETTYASEFVARKVAEHEANHDRKSQVQKSTDGPVHVLNITLGDLNYHGNAEGIERGEILTLENVNQLIAQSVLSNIDQPVRKTENQETSKENATDKKRCNNRIRFGATFLLALSTVLIIGALRISNDSSAIGSDPPTQPDKSSSRDRIGTNPLKTPVARVIVKATNATACQINSCLSNSYPNFSDTAENFIMELDGQIRKGRGFEFEGEMTFDTFGTSFNKGSIGINILMNENVEMKEIQRDKLKKFFMAEVKDGKLRSNYKILNYDEITQNANSADNQLMEMLQSLPNYEKPLTFIQSDVLKFSFEEIYHLDETEKDKVEIEVHDENVDQNEKNLTQWNDKIKFQNLHLILGENSRIQLKSFDCYMSDEDCSKLRIAILVGQQVSEETRAKVLINYASVINFLVEMGKLEKDHLVCLYNSTYKNKCSELSLEEFLVNLS